MSLITYEAIREAQRAEQAEQLQKLPEGFFDAVKNWIDYKKGKGDDLSLREIESAKKLLEDVINRRQRKLMIYAIGFVRGDVPPEGLENEEKDFFERAAGMVSEFRERMSDMILTDDGIVQKRLTEVSEIVETIKKKVEPVKNEENDTLDEKRSDVPESIVDLPKHDTELTTKSENLVIDDVQLPLNNLSSEAEHENKKDLPKTEPMKPPKHVPSENLLMGAGTSVSEPVKQQNLDNLLMGNSVSEQPHATEKMKNGLKLLVDLPKFVGGDLNSYGPFKTGDVIIVPEDVKRLLLMRKVAEETN
jgi:DNA replication initiation complex subunit (GINS family)